jgi:hypothetical protein
VAVAACRRIADLVRYGVWPTLTEVVLPSNAPLKDSGRLVTAGLRMARDERTAVVKRLVSTASSSRLVTIGYIFTGAVVSGTHHYFDNLATVREVVAALLAVLVWPLLWYPQIQIS